MKAICKTCGEVIISRRSDKRSAKANMLRAVRRHYQKKHPKTLSRRISQGLKASKDNPSYQDLIDALKEGPRSAIEVYKKYNEKQYQHIKAVMDALEPVLPTDLVISWKVLEAIHDSRIT